jgi:ABC-2 type transport system ATP-binding protein
MATSGPAIDVSHLTKVYGPTVALNDVTLSVNTGEVRGLLGPNGSGKSSLMKTIMGLTKPSYGSIHHTNRRRNASLDLLTPSTLRESKVT